MFAAFVGFASTFAVVLQGYSASGATGQQAASGLLALLVVKGFLGAYLALTTRQPIVIAWSTPGAALLIATGMPAGGFPATVGAMLVASALVVAAGLWRPFGRRVSAIPIALASAMLAGVLLDLCLAPVRAVAAMPALSLPIVLTWALAWVFARAYAVPLALLVTAAIVLGATPMSADALAGTWPLPVFVWPAFEIGAIVGLAVPMFIVTMASQNIPGLAVLQANGYRPDVGRIFVSTGLASGLISLFGGHLANLAAITAALCAGPEAHPDPRRRWPAGVAAGLTFVALGLFASVAAAFVAASPPLLIQAVAGLALLGSFAGALVAALERDSDRLPAVVTFVTTASGSRCSGSAPPSGVLSPAGRCWRCRADVPRRLRPRRSPDRRGRRLVSVAKRLVEVREQIVRVLDADRQAEQVGRAGGARSFDRGPMLDQALDAAERGGPLPEPDRGRRRDRAGLSAEHLHGKHVAEAVLHLPGGKVVAGMLGQARIEHARDRRMGREAEREIRRSGRLGRSAQEQCFQAPVEQIGLEGAKDGAAACPDTAESLPIGVRSRAREHTRDHVGMTVQDLGRGVHDDIGAKLKRARVKR
jgi:benzoate membrane transport protein